MLQSLLLSLFGALEGVQIGNFGIEWWINRLASDLLNVRKVYLDRCELLLLLPLLSTLTVLSLN